MPQARDHLGRFLQPEAPLNLPSHIGPVEFDTVGAMVAVRCPRELDPLMRKAGGQWEPGTRRWLIVRRRLGPLIRELRRSTDPLFRRAGMDLDGE
jgi:hypothetical protein